MALESLFLGLGLSSLFVSRLATQNTGATSINPAVFSEVVADARFPFPFLGEATTLGPVVGWTPWGHVAPDGGSSTHVWRLSGRISRQYGWLDLNFGPGLVGYRISGEGGGATLNNGTSTKGFSFPEGSSFATFYGVEAGIGARFNRMRFDGEAWIVDLFAARRRTLNYTLTLSIEVL